MRRLALALDVIDRPDSHRKLHAQDTPLGGGIVLLLASVVAVLGLMIFSPNWRANLLDNAWFLSGLLAGVVTICIIGTIDDRFGLRGRQKLIGQIVATAFLLLAGLRIDSFVVFGFNVELGLLAVPFTVFWMLGAVNALNLIDGVDGLATSVGTVLCLAIAGMSYPEHPVEMMLALVIAGSLVGFLVFNSPPASIFLGDGGSMLIGLVVGALAIRSSLKGPAVVALTAPTAVMAIPIFDVGMAILRRKMTGRSIYSTDRGHLHHSLLRRGFSGRKTVVTISVLCLVTASAAVVSVHQDNESLAATTTLAVMGILIASRFFGHQEFLLVCRRAKNFVVSLIPGGQRRNANGQQLQTRLQGDQEWNALWETLTSFAERFDLNSIQLNVNIPAFHEEYHATWNRKGSPDSTELWRSDIPLVAHHVTVGRLRVTGACHTNSVCTWMGDLIAGLKPFESQMAELVGQICDDDFSGNNGSSELKQVGPREEDGAARLVRSQPK